MLLGSNGASDPVFDFRPCCLREHAVNQPIQFQGRVVQDPQPDIGGGAPRFQHPQEIAADRFHQFFLPDDVKRLAGKRNLHTGEGARADLILSGHHVIHDILPSPRDHQRIVGGKVGLRDFDIEQAVVLRLVFGHEDALGFPLVPSLQALLFVGFGVVCVKHRPPFE